MSDFNSSLPIRTETNGDAAVKIVDGTVVSQALAVDASGLIGAKLFDSAGVGLTSTLNAGKQSLDVNMTNSITVGVADKTTFTYGTSAFEPIGGAFQDTSPTLTAGQSGVVRLTAQRGM